eukprot:scaffold5321_cov267-Pinguiococcus_pyrenoidosus.AAC.5
MLRRSGRSGGAAGKSPESKKLSRGSRRCRSSHNAAVRCPPRLVDDSTSSHQLRRETQLRCRAGPTCS